MTHCVCDAFVHLPGLMCRLIRGGPSNNQIVNFGLVTHPATKLSYFHTVLSRVDIEICELCQHGLLIIGKAEPVLVHAKVNFLLSSPVFI